MNGKKASPKNRRISEQYKSRHNVGRRSAVEKVASYHESDVNVAYPAGFWDAVKVEPHESCSDSDSSRSGSELSDPEPEGRMVSSDPDSDSSEEVTFKSKLENGKADTVGTQRLPRVAHPPSMIGRGKTEDKVNGSGSSGKEEYDFKGTSSDSSSEGENDFSSDDSEQNSHLSDEDYTYSTPVTKKAKVTKEKLTCYGSPRKESQNDNKKSKKSVVEVKKSKPGRKATTKPTNNTQSAPKTTSHTTGPDVRGPRIRRTACLNANAINAILYEVDEPEVKRRKQMKEKQQEMKTWRDSGDEADDDSDGDIDECVLDPSDEEISFPKKSPNNINKTLKTESPKNGTVKTEPKGRRGRPPKKVVSKSSAEESSSSDDEVAVRGKREEPSKWAPPRRMASLNAQAFISFSSDTRTERSPKTAPESPKKKSESSNTKDKRRTKSPDKSADKSKNKSAAKDVEETTKTDEKKLDLKHDGKTDEERKFTPESKKIVKEGYKKGQKTAGTNKKDMDLALGESGNENKDKMKKSAEEDRLEKNNSEKQSEVQAKSKDKSSVQEKVATKAKEQKTSPKKGQNVKIEHGSECGFVNVDGSDGELENIPANKSIMQQPKPQHSPRRASQRGTIKSEPVKTPLPTPTPSPDVQIIDVKQPSYGNSGVPPGRRLSSPSAQPYSEPNSYPNNYPTTSMHSVSGPAGSASYHHPSNSQPPSSTYPSHQPLPRSGKSDRKHSRSSTSPGYNRPQQPPGQNMYGNCEAGCYPYPLGDSGQPRPSGGYPDSSDGSGMHKQGCQSYGMPGAPPMDYPQPAGGPDMSYPHHPAYSSAAAYAAAAAMYPHSTYDYYPQAAANSNAGSSAPGPYQGSSMSNDPCLPRPQQMSFALHQPQVKVLVHNHAPLAYPQPTPPSHIGMPPQMYPPPPSGVNKSTVPPPPPTHTSGHASNTASCPPAAMEKPQESKQYLNLDMQQNSYRHREHRSGSKPFSSSLASRSTSSKAEGVIPSYSADSIVPNTGSATVSTISVTSNQDKLMPSTNSETNAKADNKSNTLQVDKLPSSSTCDRPSSSECISISSSPSASDGQTTPGKTSTAVSPTQDVQNQSKITPDPPDKDKTTAGECEEEKSKSGSTDTNTATVAVNKDAESKNAKSPRSAKSALASKSRRSLLKSSPRAQLNQQSQSSSNDHSSKVDVGSPNSEKMPKKEHVKKKKSKKDKEKNSAKKDIAKKKKKKRKKALLASALQNQIGGTDVDSVVTDSSVSTFDGLKKKKKKKKTKHKDRESSMTEGKVSKRHKGKKAKKLLQAGSKRTKSGKDGKKKSKKLKLEKAAEKKSTENEIETEVKEMTPISKVTPKKTKGGPQQVMPSKEMEQLKIDVSDVACTKRTSPRKTTVVSSAKSPVNKKTALACKAVHAKQTSPVGKAVHVKQTSPVGKAVHVKQTSPVGKAAHSKQSSPAGKAAKLCSPAKKVLHKPDGSATKAQSTKLVSPVPKTQSTKQISPAAKAQSTKQISPATKAQTAKLVSPATKAQTAKLVSPATKAQSTKLVSPITKAQSAKQVSPATKPMNAKQGNSTSTKQSSSSTKTVNVKQPSHVAKGSSTKQASPIRKPVAAFGKTPDRKQLGLVGKGTDKKVASSVAKTADKKHNVEKKQQPSLAEPAKGMAKPTACAKTTKITCDKESVKATKKAEILKKKEQDKLHAKLERDASKMCKKAAKELLKSTDKVQRKKSPERTFTAVAVKTEVGTSQQKSTAAAEKSKASKVKSKDIAGEQTVMPGKCNRANTVKSKRVNFEEVTTVNHIPTANHSESKVMRVSNTVIATCADGDDGAQESSSKKRKLSPAKIATPLLAAASRELSVAHTLCAMSTRTSPAKTVPTAPNSNVSKKPFAGFAKFAQSLSKNTKEPVKAGKSYAGGLSLAKLNAKPGADLSKFKPAAIKVTPILKVPSVLQKSSVVKPTGSVVKSPTIAIKSKDLSPKIKSPTLKARERSPSKSGEKPAKTVETTEYPPLMSKGTKLSVSMKVEQKIASKLSPGKKDSGKEKCVPLRQIFLPEVCVSEKKGTKRKRDLTPNWQWVGEPTMKPVVSEFDDTPTHRPCYKAVQHSDGDTICVRDCVLVKSGPRQKDLPYIAKVAELWKKDDTGDMMMSLLWYYRPEHTQTDRLPAHVDQEVFASRHRDHTSVACIEDRCYVLTFNQFCRHQAEMRRRQTGSVCRQKIVPDLQPNDGEMSTLNRSERLCRTALTTKPYGTVYLCRKVYDFKRKRILKNPRPDSLLYSGFKRELDASPMDLSLGRTSRASLRRECTKRKMYESDSNSSYSSTSSGKRQSTERTTAAGSKGNTISLVKSHGANSKTTRNINNSNSTSISSVNVNKTIVSHQPLIAPASSTVGATVTQTSQFQLAGTSLTGAAISGTPRVGFHTLPFSIIPQPVGPIRQRGSATTQRFVGHHLPFMLLQPRILSTVPQRALIRAPGASNNSTTTVAPNAAQLTTLIQQQTAVLQAQNAVLRAGQFPVVISNTVPAQAAAVPMVTSVPTAVSNIVSGTAAVTGKTQPEPAQSPGEGETATASGVDGSSASDSAATALDLTMAPHV